MLRKSRILLALMGAILVFIFIYNYLQNMQICGGPADPYCGAEGAERMTYLALVLGSVFGLIVGYVIYSLIPKLKKLSK